MKKEAVRLFSLLAAFLFALSLAQAVQVPASPATFSVPQQALAMLLATQSGTAGSIGQIVISGSVATPGTSTAVSSTSQTLVPSLVGGGQVNYGFFGPSLTVSKSVSVQ